MEPARRRSPRHLPPPRREEEARRPRRCPPPPSLTRRRAVPACCTGTSALAEVSSRRRAHTWSGTTCALPGPCDAARALRCFVAQGGTVRGALPWWRRVRRCGTPLLLSAGCSVVVRSCPVAITLGCMRSTGRAALSIKRTTSTTWRGGSTTRSAQPSSRASQKERKEALRAASGQRAEHVSSRPKPPDIPVQVKKGILRYIFVPEADG